MYIQQEPGSGTSIHLKRLQVILIWMVAGLVFQGVTIRSLPDEVLLEIFQFYRVAVIINGDYVGDPTVWHKTWQKLVHVCRRWRAITFASPLGLDLQLYCTPETPVRKLLNVWPPLPLVIYLLDYPWERRSPDWDSEGTDRWDNVIAAMECRDRVRQIQIFDLSSSLWAQVSTMMQQPFPALTEMCLRCKLDPGHVAELPDTFLNGSAPHLQHLVLERIFFPSLRSFLLSTSDLTSLSLMEIPNEGYIPPEAMAASLSALPKLETLHIKFASPTPQPKRITRPTPPETRSVLSALTLLDFKGVSEYLEVLVAQIDAPMLVESWLCFFNQLEFDIPQISWLIGNLRIPRPAGLSLRFSENDHANIRFSWSRMGSHGTGKPYLNMDVLGKGLDWQVFLVAQICNQILPLCSSVEWLNVEYSDRWGNIEPPPRMRPDDMDHGLWLELFHSFISVKHLEIYDELGPFVAAALQGVTKESATGIFPMLNSFSIVGNTTYRVIQKGIESFVTSRQHSDHPVAFHRLNHSDGVISASHYLFY
jgi:F-box-like